jgi:hypothetical protein
MHATARGATVKGEAQVLRSTRKGDTTPAEVPCDIKPPFSEPECPQQ